jgi:hypothetical protein
VGDIWLTQPAFGELGSGGKNFFYKKSDGGGQLNFGFAYVCYTSYSGPLTIVIFQFC